MLSAVGSIVSNDVPPHSKVRRARAREEEQREERREEELLVSFAAAKHGSEVKNPNITSFTKTLCNI